MKKAVLPVLILLLSLPCFLRADEGHHHDMDASEKLGNVSFQTSCSADVQRDFEHGVALLHSFGYSQAEVQFDAVVAKDPHCAIARWGQAMSLYHQLWDRPEAATLKQGRERLEAAQKTGAKTQRERDYIAALAVFYRGDEKMDFHQRTVAYSQAMKKLYEQYPADHEAAVFYALSLLSSAPDHDTTLANPRLAIAILNKVYEEAPDHPGVAHYLIHASDNPQLAQLGLAAARRYAQIAPASPHALHMPSHIFARLGYWQEDIQSNLAAVAAMHAGAKKHMGAEYQVHPMDFLLYAYLQIGGDAKARQLIDQLTPMSDADMGPGMAGYLGAMKSEFPATYALETRHWEDAVALTPLAGAEPNDQAITYWAQAVGAGHLKNQAAAKTAVEHYETMVEATRKGPKSYIAEYMDGHRDEARAWLAFAEGKNDEALSLLRKVADKQDLEGKGEVELPAREMLADMLLQMGRPQEALAEYEASMKVDPNRFNGLYGAARAAGLANQPKKAATYYAQLLKNCGQSTERPELAQARDLLAKN